MDNYKINQANKIYSKMQGIIWAREKNEEYHHYDACKNCCVALRALNKELEELNLNEEEQAMVGYGHVDYAIAYRYEGLYR